MSSATTPPPLNPAQKAAVEFAGRSVLVIAGAGSGKTHVITQRIARLIAQGFPARTIFSVTFTNKASEEMAERIAKLVGHEKAKDLWTSTFHALGAEIVRQEARYVAGGEKFVVYDAVDAQGVVKEILRQMNVVDRRYDVGAIMARISHAKNALTTPDELADESEYDEVARQVFPRYAAAMKRLNALDFDDLILVPLRLLEENHDVRTRWTTRARHLLIDEFQDTSRAQLLFVKALASGGATIFCVGDDDQAIYGWRGADVRNVIDFPLHFPGSEKLALEQNFRSRQPILDVANTVIQKAERAYPKVLFSDKKRGDPVTLVECDNHESETQFVIETSKTALSNGLPRREIGVLYRSNGLAKPLEEAFRLAGIPYRMIGGQSFYDRREVKDLTAYLRLSLSPNDDISFRRVVNYPARGIGDTSFERLERYARARGIPLFEAAKAAGVIPDMDDRAKSALGGFVRLVTGVGERIERGEPLSDVARATADAIGLRADITAAGPTTAVATKRMGNIEELYRTLAKAMGTPLPPTEGGAPTPAPVAPSAKREAKAATARQVLARLALRFADEEEQGAHDRVTLSTLHGAKGLEFGMVFLVGCDEGILPHARMDAPKATDIASTIDSSEERRLFYVGVTRAKEKLYLLRAKLRALRGAPRATAGSRFLYDLPDGMLEKRAYAGQPAMATQDLAAAARAAREALFAMKKKAGP